MTKEELASMLWSFTNNDSSCGEWDWDDFISVSASAELEPYRQRLLREVDPYLGIADKQPNVRVALLDVIRDLRAAE